MLVMMKKTNFLLFGFVIHARSRLNERPKTEQVPNMQAVVHDWLHSDDLLSLLAEEMEMKVLVACEYSGRVRTAFRDLGHDAWSCDIIPAEDKSEFHIQLDVTEVLNDGWDMMIAFPPCQFLSNAGARWLYPDGKVCFTRMNQLEEARTFFLQLWQAPIPRIAIENPTPLKAAELPTYSQIIQPWQFGDPYTKRTLLWLKRLPQLLATETVEPMKSWTLSKRQVTDRSRTFQGIADAMANQWSNPLTLEMFMKEAYP